MAASPQLPALLREPTRVAPRLPCSWTDRPARWLLPAVVLVFGLGWQVAAASSVSPARAFDGEEHAHHCKCGPRCRGASCCCGPRESKVKETSPPPAAEPVRADGGPCLNSTPCSDPVLPSAPSAGPIGKVATLAMCGYLVPVAAWRFLPPSPRRFLPARRASRLDDPPESPPLA